MASTLTLKEAAERAGVTPATLKRWAETGVIPGVNGKKPEWTPAAIAHARIVARLRERGHTLEQIRRASFQCDLATGIIENRRGCIQLRDDRLSTSPVAHGKGRGRLLNDRF